MSPARESYYRNVFRLACAYDGLLGIVFLFLPTPAFDALGIRDKLPSFGGYVALIAAFVLVLAFGYFLIARGDLQRNLDLILVGVVYKFSYCAVAAYFSVFEPPPHWIFSVLFGGFDFIFFVAMAECYLHLKKSSG